MMQFFTRKMALAIVLLLILIGTTPYSSAYATGNGNVFDCVENKQDCTENETPIVERETGTDDEIKPVGVTAWEYVKTVLALIFVVGLLFALLKFMNRKNRLYDKNRLMKNMGGISLGQHKSMQLVVVGDTYYLIGVGDDIRLLKEITDPTEIERLTEYYEEADVDPTIGWLDRLLTKKKSIARTNETPSDFSNVFNTRLDEMKKERSRHIRQLTEKEHKKDE